MARIQSHCARRATATCGLFSVLLSGAASASIADFSTWTLAEDPPDPNLSASVDSPSQVILTAVGPVPAAADIGYQSIDGNTAATSTAGFAFDPTASFSVAVDYDWSFSGTLGGSAIGFGIGEDGAGDQSAGAALAAVNTTILGTGAAARTSLGDSAVPIAFGGSATGSMHVSYDADTGNITLGTGAVAANAPSASTTLPGGAVYDLWNTDADDDLLIVSLFIRSDNTLGPALTAGSTTAVFSNLRVISGSPTLVPEPGSLALLGLGSLLIARRRRG